MPAETPLAVPLPGAAAPAGAGPGDCGEPGPPRDPRVLEPRENFPVALRLLPRATRAHLRAVYDVARVIDDLGDEAAGDRTGALDRFEHRLRAVWSDDPPRDGVTGALVASVRACRLPPEPFLALVEANRLDQQRDRYPTWAELHHYCTLSADPVGRIVLGVFGAATPERIVWSDDVCTALQLLEHCQDVAEDRRRGRVYLPQEDLQAFGVAETVLDLPRAGAGLRRLVGFEVDRAARLLDSGVPLVRSLHGWARVAVAGYVGGGRATVDAIRRAGGDVLGRDCRPGKPSVAKHAVRVLAGAR